MTQDSLFSDHWHRVSDVRTQLAEDVLVTRHVYRNRVSWILHRPGRNNAYRMDVASFDIIDRLDGSLSVGELWEQALELHDHEAPTQDEFMRLLADLHAAELLVVDSRIPVEKLFERRKTERSRDRRQRYLNPLYLRFALFDIDTVLNRFKFTARCLFSKTMFIVWFCLCISSVTVLFTHSERLFADVHNAMQLSPYTAMLFLFLYPILKLLHEAGHALAVKRCGGEVHEMGIAILVMLPLPYIDASASSVFKAKSDRMLVSAAGILIELGIAAMGVFLWASNTGFASDIGLVLMLIGGLSTVLINGNPLLKFDGYYLFSDWLEIPNLQSRAKRAVNALLFTILSKDDHPIFTQEDQSEKRWLLSYGVMAAVYRTGLMLSIAWFISERWFVFGVALAVFALFQAIGLPIWRALKVLFQNQQLQSFRAKALGLGVPMLIIAMVTYVPVPHASVTRGVVWLPDNAVVRAASTCEVRTVEVPVGSTVKIGDVLFQCVDSVLDAQQEYLVALVDEYEAVLSGMAQDNPLEYARKLPELETAKARLQDVQLRGNAQLHRAAVDGTFDISGTSELLGRTFKQGDIAGYTVPTNGRTIRLAIAEKNIHNIDHETERVEVRLHHSTNNRQVYPTSVRHRAIRASNQVASAALSTEGGGPHLAQASGDGRLLEQAVIDIELVWPDGLSNAPIGEMVAVRFVHTAKPLAGRLMKKIKQAFMDRQPV